MQKQNSIKLTRRTAAPAGPVRALVRQLSARVKTAGDAQAGTATATIRAAAERPRVSSRPQLPVEKLAQQQVRSRPLAAALAGVQAEVADQVRAIAGVVRADLRAAAAAPARPMPPAGFPVLQVLSQWGSATRATSLTLPNPTPTTPTTTTLPNAAPAADSAVTSGVTVGHSNLVLSASDGVTVPADWYYPDNGTAPTGVIYLQHGFFRSNKNVSALATQLALQTNSVVVAPTVSSNPFECGGYWINGVPTQQAVANLFSTDSGREALALSAAEAGYTGTLPEQYVLAGHSAGGNLVTGAAGYAAASGDPPVAVILFDAVDNGGTMAAGLAKLPSTVPVYQIASTPCLCNSFGSGTRALIKARPDQFVGVRLVGGTHVDAEGASTDVLASLVCGFSRPSNQSAVPIIAAGWINDVYNGTTDGLYGVPGERLKVGRATAVVLR